MSNASEVLGELIYSAEPSGWMEPDGTDAFCFRNELWRLKGWQYEEGPEWNRFPDWLGPDDREAVMQRAGLVETALDDEEDFARLRAAAHPGMAMFHLKRYSDGAEAAHVEYAFSVSLISRYWTAAGRGDSPGWPLRPEYLPLFEVKLLAVLVDETQDPHTPPHPQYIPRSR
jgi:hypothetical protein